MKRTFAATLVALSLGAWFPAQASVADDVRAVYDQFAAAQNARDLAKVRTFLVDSPKFLWVSDGMSFWGPDALVKRMAEFQLAEVWRVDLISPTPPSSRSVTARPTSTCRSRSLSGSRRSPT